MKSQICVAVVFALLTTLRAELPKEDYRIIKKPDLLTSESDIFTDNTTKSFTQLLFDVAREQVIVGARDAIYRLSLRTLKLIEKANWPAPVEKAKLCQDKGQTEEDCHNYIKILLAHGHKLFACGTNAFSPQCSWRGIESVSNVLEWVEGVPHCPYNPHSNVTAILTNGGEYYTGTATDFAGSDSTICRSRGASVSNVQTLRTTQYDLNWLDEPQFVGSFEDDSYVYFVFREVAVEYMNCGKTIYSRVARVCKNDVGGHLLMKNNWSTFLKARLICSVPAEYPFYYDEVQSIEYRSDKKLLFAVFTTPSSSIAGSAVCAYNMSDISAVFEGPYKVQDSPTSTWEPKTASRNSKEHFRCNKEVGSRSVMEYRRYYLMYDVIQPISGQPIYQETLERFTQITVDVTETKNVDEQFVLFVATQNNDIIKLAVLPQFKGACLVELWKLRDLRSDFDVQNMQFVKETMSVYIGGSLGVVRVGALRCGRHVSRAACVGAADPHCGWEAGARLCLPRRNGFGFGSLGDPAPAPLRCPLEDMPVNGGWSSWSDWQPCIQDTGVPHYNYGEQEKPDMCQCRSRQCDNPKPANGGQDCIGAGTAVCNCTVHGGWSPWSSWSECSASCGLAVKSRRRSCSAPEPKHGGRVCVGPETADMYCYNLPPCPDPTLAPVDGGWSSWSAWSTCAGAAAGSCGASAGQKERRRDCDNPKPLNGGAACEGSKVERQPCDLRPCELKKATAWSPWVQSPNSSSDGSYMEKRFKFICKAPTSETIRLQMAKEEERYCNANGGCSSKPEAEPAWEAWGPWGECSASCGGGHQARGRSCRRPPCSGAADMLRPCNTHACTGEWSCWSEWSACEGGEGCGAAGHRSRSRSCLSPAGCAGAQAAHQRMPCVNSNCQGEESGWGSWGAWEECEGGERVRRRECERGGCLGAMMQVALCGDDVENDLSSPYSAEMASFVSFTKEESMSVSGIVGCAIAAFVVGCVCTLAGVIICVRRSDGSYVSKLPWRRTPKVPSSPHYMTQNTYVSIPLKNPPRKAKRQPSFTGIGGASGILLSKSNNISNANNQNVTTTPKLYPKAIANEYDSMGTLKRHSNQPNNKNNIDLEEDRFY